MYQTLQIEKRVKHLAWTPQRGRCLTLWWQPILCTPGICLERPQAENVQLSWERPTVPRTVAWAYASLTVSPSVSACSSARPDPLFHLCDLHSLTPCLSGSTQLWSLTWLSCQWPVPSAGLINTLSNHPQWLSLYLTSWESPELCAL